MENRILPHQVIVDEAVKQAKLIAKKSPPEIGSVVAHPSDPISYELRQVDTDSGVATVGYIDPKTQEDVVRRYPLIELFDLNLAARIALSIKMKKARKALGMPLIS